MSQSNQTNDVHDLGEQPAAADCLAGALPIASSSPADGRTCCRLPQAFLIGGLAAVALGAMLTAAYFAGRASSASDAQATVKWNLPAIDATASATSEKFSMSTGPVSEDAEGLFVLDHNSGLVQCNVIYPRVGRYMAQYTANVAEGLGTGGKGGEYIMVTGQVNFPSASNRPAGGCILYVLDTGTGNFACYGVPFDRVVMNRNQPQQGTLRLIHQGTANPLIDRDNLR